MENMGEWEKHALINELTKGRELASQLHTQLNSPSSSLEVRELLVGRIQDSYRKALSMLNCSSSSGGDVGIEVPCSESAHSIDYGSPRSDQDSRKRNTIPSWTQKVRLSPGMPVEVPVHEDGFTWRKYGQKDILGAKYPRAYYRCTHRNVQGCLATKQVQRSDDDPNILELTYRGRHTCTQVSPTPDQNRLEEPNNTNCPSYNLPQNRPEELRNLEQQSVQDHDMILNSYHPFLTAISENLEIDDQSFPSFDHHLGSTSDNVNNPPDDQFFQTLFVSDPVTSEMMSYNFAGYALSTGSSGGFVDQNINLQMNPENHDHLLSDVISVPTTSSTTCPSTTVSTEFSFHGAESDPNFNLNLNVKDSNLRD